MTDLRDFMSKAYKMAGAKDQGFSQVLSDRQARDSVLKSAYGFWPDEFLSMSVTFDGGEKMLVNLLKDRIDVPGFDLTPAMKSWIVETLLKANFVDTVSVFHSLSDSESYPGALAGPNDLKNLVRRACSNDSVIVRSKDRCFALKSATIAPGQGRILVMFVHDVDDGGCYVVLVLPGGDPKVTVFSVDNGRVVSRERTFVNGAQMQWWSDAEKVFCLLGENSAKNNIMPEVSVPVSKDRLKILELLVALNGFTDDQLRIKKN